MPVTPPVPPISATAAVPGTGAAACGGRGGGGGGINIVGGGGGGPGTPMVGPELMTIGVTVLGALSRDCRWPANNFTVSWRLETCASKLATCPA